MPSNLRHPTRNPTGDPRRSKVVKDGFHHEPQQSNERLNLKVKLRVNYLKRLQYPNSLSTGSSHWFHCQLPSVKKMPSQDSPRISQALLEHHPPGNWKVTLPKSPSTSCPTNEAQTRKRFCEMSSFCSLPCETRNSQDLKCSSVFLQAHSTLLPTRPSAIEIPPAFQVAY